MSNPMFCASRKPSCPTMRSLGNVSPRSARQPQAEGREDVNFLHRWHDPSQAFSIQPDINKLELHIEGARRLTTEYADAL